MQQYDVLEHVGEGTYGVVLKCRHRLTGAVVAVKQFKDAGANAYVRRTVQRELRVHRLLRGQPHIVPLLDVFRDDDRLYLVMAYVPRNLLDVLDAQPSGLRLAQLRVCMYTLLLAVRSCHVHGVVHRDIKPENVLVYDDDTAALCDFGFARRMHGATWRGGSDSGGDTARVATTTRAASDSCSNSNASSNGRNVVGSASATHDKRNGDTDAHDNNDAAAAATVDARSGNAPYNDDDNDDDDERAMTNYVATRWYRSPEMLLGVPHYGGEVDMWAVGVLLAEAADGEPLLPGESEFEQLQLIHERIGAFAPDDMAALRRCGVAWLPPSSCEDTTDDNADRQQPQQQQQTCTTTRQASQRDYLQQRYEHCLGVDGVDLLRRLLDPCARTRATVHEALAHAFFATLHCRDEQDGGVCRSSSVSKSAWQHGDDDHDVVRREANARVADTRSLVADDNNNDDDGRMTATATTATTTATRLLTRQLPPPRAPRATTNNNNNNNSYNNSSYNNKTTVCASPAAPTTATTRAWLPSTTTASACVARQQKQQRQQLLLLQLQHGRCHDVDDVVATRSRQLSLPARTKTPPHTRPAATTLPARLPPATALSQRTDAAAAATTTTATTTTTRCMRDADDKVTDDDNDSGNVTRTTRAVALAARSRDTRASRHRTAQRSRALHYRHDTLTTTAAAAAPAGLSAWDVLLAQTYGLRNRSNSNAACSSSSRSASNNTTTTTCWQHSATKQTAQAAATATTATAAVLTSSSSSSSGAREATHRARVLPCVHDTSQLARPHDADVLVVNNNNDDSNNSRSNSHRRRRRQHAHVAAMRASSPPPPPSVRSAAALLLPPPSRRGTCRAANAPPLGDRYNDNNTSNNTSNNNDNAHECSLGTAHGTSTLSPRTRRARHRGVSRRRPSPSPPPSLSPPPLSAHARAVLASPYAPHPRTRRRRLHRAMASDVYHDRDDGGRSVRGDGKIDDDDNKKSGDDDNNADDMPPRTRAVATTTTTTWLAAPLPATASCAYAPRVA